MNGASVTQLRSGAFLGALWLIRCESSCVEGSARNVAWHSVVAFQDKEQRHEAAAT